MYHFYGPSYNLEFVRDVLAALQNIVNVGDMEADEERKVNLYAIKFDLEAIDKLQSTLSVLATLPNQAAWKAPPKEGEKSIEQRLQWLLFKLKKAHDANTQDSASRHVSAQIVQIWKQYFPPKDSNTPLDENVRVGEMLLLKCVHNEEVRVVEVAENIEFPALNTLLETKYGRQLNITFKDDEGDYVTIDDQASLLKAISFFKKKTGRTIRLHLFDSHSTGADAALRPLRDSTDSPPVRPPSGLASPPDSPDVKAIQSRRLSLNSAPLRNLVNPPVQGGKLEVFFFFLYLPKKKINSL